MAIPTLYSQECSILPIFTSRFETAPVYVNGNLADSYSDFAAWNFVAEDLTKLQFGYFGDSSHNTVLDIDNVLIYSRPLDAAAVKALIIPEPTTATLSLLALAGLAARRRRK